VAERWNIVAAIGLGGFYVLANLVIFVPAWCKQRSAVAQLSGYKRESAVAQVERTSVDSSEQNPMIDQPRGGGEGEATPPRPCARDTTISHCRRSELTSTE
jgi:hypothetical protein